MLPLPIRATVPALNRLPVAAATPGASLLVCCHIGRPTTQSSACIACVLHLSGALVRRPQRLNGDRP
jgi:hypothetical protein